MKRKELTILLLVFLAIIVEQLHTFWNNAPLNEVDWFVFVDMKQDVQWYICETSDYLSSLFLSIVLLKILPYRLKSLGWCLIGAFILDIINYWLFYHQFDWIYKSLVIILPTLLILTHEKGNNNRASH